MQANMGSLDRIIRTVVALIFAGLILTGVVSGIWAIVLGVLGIVFLLTSAISFCPLYLPFRIRTR